MMITIIVIIIVIIIVVIMTIIISFLQKRPYPYLHNSDRFHDVRTVEKTKGFGGFWCPHPSPENHQLEIPDISRPSLESPNISPLQRSAPESAPILGGPVAQELLAFWMFPLTFMWETRTTGWWLGHPSEKY